MTVLVFLIWISQEATIEDSRDGVEPEPGTTDYKYCMYLGGHKSGVADRTLGVGGGEAVAA